VEKNKKRFNICSAEKLERNLMKYEGAYLTSKSIVGYALNKDVVTDRSK
jgi:hypothetical protein